MTEIPVAASSAATADADLDPADEPVLEHAVLEVRPGEEPAFVAAFSTAKMLISRSPGFVSLRLDRCMERPHVFLLLVEWESLAAHVDGFRGGPDYPQWRAQLHHFYQPMPLVEHFQPIDAV